jgi:hypothetical protein
MLNMSEGSTKGKSKAFESDKIIQRFIPKDTTYFGWSAFITGG